MSPQPGVEQFLVMGFKRGRCVRLEFWGPLKAQRCVRALREWGFAVTVLTPLERTPPAPSTPPATP